MLHFWDYNWELDEKTCPCDIHFIDWLAEHAPSRQRIFHFGTGGHHVLGIRAAESGAGHSILGITASPQEYDHYVKLVIDRPTVGRNYKVFFGDIYQLDPTLLPEFDVVTLFHVREFRSDKNDAYEALTDLEMMRMLVDKLRPGGHVLFYTGSFAFDQARHDIDALVAERPLARMPDFKTLEVYRKA